MDNSYCSLLNISASMLSVGALATLSYHLSYLHKKQERCESILDNKVSEFKEVTKKACEANNSHANAMIDMQSEILSLSERISMLDSNIKMSGKPKHSWKN